MLAIAALFALTTIILTRRAGHAQATTEAANRWNEEAFRNARARFRGLIATGGPEKLRDEMMKLRAAGSKDYYDLLAILDYFEDLAILLRYRAITFPIVYDSLGGTVNYYWTNCEAFVKALRAEGTATVYQCFEQLGNRIAREAKSHKAWTRTKWTDRSARGARTKFEKRLHILSPAVDRAREIALEKCPDLMKSDLVLVAHSLSETEALDDASAMIVMRGSDGSTISIHMWDGGLRYTASRVLPA
ncbi:DUF4760 domain-containing protein [Mycobacterium sp. 050134]|uniref:DUF4760 domain-containing protein n=1 Tax=Mycobacterium sp. 050134 TaxID=3096111 RepID=UPI002ED7E4FF